MKQPNVVFVFGDQWRGQATGYSGDPNVQTPNLDKLARESINCTHAISGFPVCSPYRASLLTGQYALTHGVFVNDVCLDPKANSLGKSFASAGYDTAYIGKWHVDGHGRSNYIPPERRQGFEYWKVLECTHRYNESPFYANSSDVKQIWDGYDAMAQTRDALSYIQNHSGSKPFLMVLSWGPPHNPYETAPAPFRAMYDPATVWLRPNVPERAMSGARKDLAGYYAHCSALDYCVGELLKTIEDKGIADDTLFIFTSDHGDMLGSHGQNRKQRPWEESIRVPFLLRWPGKFGRSARELDALIDAPDLMPTMLGLCGLSIPSTVQGFNFADYLRGGADPADGEALLLCPNPFGEFTPNRHAGREYRGLRTERYTYVKDLAGPWMLYDNERDPYQIENLIASPESADLIRQLDERLQRKLRSQRDEFLSGTEYLRRWGYITDASGTVPYRN